jgi:hypothetical protein
MTGRHFADGSDQFFGAGLLANIGRRARFQGGHDVGLAGVHGQNDNARARRFADGAASDFEAIEIGEHQIEHQDVGFEFLDETNSFQPVGGLADKTDIGLALEEFPKTLSNNAMVIR